MRLLIIRHAEPDYTKDSLTEKGFREAQLLSERLIKTKIDKIYLSPLGRAQATAKPYLEKSGKSFTVCDWLEEFSGKSYNAETGEYKRPWDQLPSIWTKEKDYFDRDRWNSTDFMQSGDINEKYEWVCRGLDSILADNGYVKEGEFYRVERENTDTLALFCHFGVECVLLSRLWNVSPLPLWHGLVALPSSVTVLNTEEREKGIASFRCCQFGDISHLYAADEPASFMARFCETFSSEDRH